MANFNIKEVRRKMVEAGRKIEAMSAQMETLKQKKEQLLDARQSWRVPTLTRNPKSCCARPFRP